MRLIDADALEKEYRGQFESVYKNTRDTVLPSDYYIERAAAYNKEVVRQDMEAFCKFLQRRPTIDAMPKWISVEERLPEIGDQVLVTDDFGCVSTGTCDTFGYWRRISVDGCSPFGCIPTVKYWMPLPEPPKGE